MSLLNDYLGEIRIGWRPLLSASLGLTAGTSSNYLNNLFSPALVAEFGWEKSQFALIGLTVAIAAICLPFAGRVVDRFGTRRMAIVGVISLPLVHVAMSQMSGSFTLFFVLSLAQMLIVSCIAGILVYTRLIAHGFDRARGIALGIAACAAPLASALVSPFLSGIIAEQGWRTGYLVWAGYSAVLGLIALLLIPPGTEAREASAPAAGAAPRGMGEILRHPAFQLVFVALLLVNLHFTILTTQINLILTDRGVSAETAAWMLSLFASGVVAGRVLCGVALDRFPAHLVAFVSFAIPTVGLSLLALDVPDTLLIATAILCLGVSMGAESDIIVYLASRYFRLEIFSTLLGLFTAAMAISALAGALMLSLILRETGSYTLFLVITATAMLAGCLSFLFLPRAAARPGGGAIPPSGKHAPAN